MLLYDNADDVKAKLAGTLCYHGGKACLVREAMPDFDHEQQKEIYLLRLQFLNSRHYKTVKLDDPDFNYMRFNLGYSNHGHSAVWWYRIPIKQYHQGLRHNQLKKRLTNPAYAGHVEFGLNLPICNMMEAVYPDFEQCVKDLKDGDANVSAFHQDFAASWDKVHKDLIIEYKGVQVGSLISRDNFNLMDEYKHLTEALKEAVA